MPAIPDMYRLGIPLQGNRLGHPVHVADAGTVFGEHLRPSLHSTSYPPFIENDCSSPIDKHKFDIYDRNVQPSRHSRVATAMLDGEIEYRRGNFEVAFEHLRAAIKADDALMYTEPWGWLTTVFYIIQRVVAKGRGLLFFC